VEIILVAGGELPLPLTPPLLLPRPQLPPPLLMVAVLVAAVVGEVVLVVVVVPPRQIHQHHHHDHPLTGKSGLLGLQTAWGLWKRQRHVVRRQPRQQHHS
jgi:hypothetical protein